MSRARHAARVKLQDELREKAIEVNVYHEICLHFEPGAIPARLLEAKIGPFVSAVNEGLRILTNGLYQIDVRAEAGLAIRIAKKLLDGPPAMLTPEQLCKSERMRIGFALASVLAIHTGVGIVAIDDLESMDTECLRMLGDLIDGGHVEHTILVKLMSERPDAVSDERISYFWVDNGTVEKLDSVAS